MQRSLQEKTYAWNNPISDLDNVFQFSVVELWRRKAS